VIHVITWIATQLPTPQGWKAELPCARSQTATWALAHYFLGRGWAYFSFGGALDPIPMPGYKVTEKNGKTSPVVQLRHFS